MDLSKVILKAVLLHNGNKFLSVSPAHAATMDSCENKKLLLEKSSMKNIIGK